MITLYALLCAWVNWSGARRWSATQAMLKAEGETLDFRAILNEPVPEDQNFCAIPPLRDIALVVDHDAKKGAPAAKRQRLEELKLSSEGKDETRPKLTNAAFGKATDLKAWADWLRQENTQPGTSGNAARDVLAALAKHDALVRELAAGLNRPQAQWTPEWKTRELPEDLYSIPIPHLSCRRIMNQTLCLRATAAARAVQAAMAHETALIMARLTQADLNDPTLISLLLAAAETNHLCGTTWELCEAQAGTAEDFTRLEAALAGLDFRRAALRSFRSEMAASVNTLQFYMHENNLAPLLAIQNGDDPGSPGSHGFILRAVPSGLLDASLAVLADSDFKYLIKPLRDQGWQAARQAAIDWETELAGMKEHAWTHPAHILTAVAAPAMNAIVNNAIYAQTLVNQAIIACALERHRLEKGNYPDSLDALKLADGRPLPPDVINGKPMNHRKDDRGRYILWSIGFDGKDDGGKRVLDEKTPERTRFSDGKYAGDWVWDYPAP